jgi:hypothetical protein
MAGRQEVGQAIAYVKDRGTDYMDLAGRKLVDSAIAVLVGHLLLGQGARSERKKRVARRFIDTEMPKLRLNCELVLRGDMSPLEEYALLAGPVPAKN